MPQRVKQANRQPQQAVAPAPPSLPPPVSPRFRLACAAGVAVVILAVYQATLLRTVVDIDSGELVAAVHVQGIPHPTGYPLWLLLGRLFDVLPLGHTSAYRVGVMNSVSVAAAGAIITLVALDLTGMALPAMFAGLAFGFWSPPWGDSVRAMVHAMSGVFVALAILALRRWHRERTAKALLLFALAMGVAGMHHRTAVLAVGPAFLAALYLTPPKARWEPTVVLAWLGVSGLLAAAASATGLLVMAALFAVMAAAALVRWRRLRAYLGVAALVVAPFSLYLYLWVRATQHPPVYWTDVTTFPRLMHHIFAQQYTQFAFQQSSEQAVQQTMRMVPQLLAGPGGLSVLMALVGLPLIAWGGWVWWKRERWVAGPLAVGTALLLLWVTHWGEASDLKHFLSPIGPALAVAGALGAAELSKRRELREYAWVVPALAGVLICGPLLNANWPQYDFSNRWGNRDRWAAALQQMEPNAVFVSDFDQPSFVTIYLQNVEKLRPDVLLLRATRLNDRGYLDMIPDPEVRAAAKEIGFPARTRSQVEFNEAAAGFAYQLARKLEGRRPVYAVHGPLTMQLPGPPYFESLSMDLVRVTMARPDLGRRGQGAALASFPNGADLVGLGLDRAEAGTGELVHFIARWRLRAPLPQSQFALALLPQGASPERAVEVPDEQARLVQFFPFLYGQWGLPPSPAEAVYEQRGTLIVPSNAPPGKYQVVTAVGLPMQEDLRPYVGWTAVPGATVEVRARPLPANGP
jgi:4-amino-4-deoxy-L-arabinose transferase-like glycosyltransferase